ncbi:MAG TPA: hypothetical protein VMC44_03950, partial [Geobacteraceae bacterium]|nr:hypothetical protein [Geobacteraceae bacterium]
RVAVIQGMKKPVKAGSAETGLGGVNGSVFPFSGRTSPWSYEAGVWVTWSGFDLSGKIKL